MEKNLVVPPGTTPISEEQLKRAISALLKHVQILNSKKKENKSELFEEDQLISLIITLKKIPSKASNKPQLIPIPHPLYKEESEVCVISKDPQKDFKTKFQQQNIKCKVIGVSKLRKNYKSYEAKRTLCSSYDLFLCDDRVMPLLHPLIGKAFFVKKKQPVPISFKKGDWKKVITEAMTCTSLFKTSGVCSSVRIGRTSQSQDQIFENIIEFMKKAIKLIPKQWKNIQALHIKTSNSLALPIYNSLPYSLTIIDVPENEKNIQVDEKEESKEENKEEEFEEDQEFGEEEFEEDEEFGEGDEEEEERSAPVLSKTNQNSKKSKSSATLPTTISKPNSINITNKSNSSTNNQKNSNNNTKNSLIGKKRKEEQVSSEKSPQKRKKKF